VLPPVLPCLPWFVGLFVAVIFIVFCRVVGHLLKFLFLLRWLGGSFAVFLLGFVRLEKLQMCHQMRWLF